MLSTTDINREFVRVSLFGERNCFPIEVRLHGKSHSLSLDAALQLERELRECLSSLEEADAQR